MCGNFAIHGAHEASQYASRGGILELARRALRTSRGRKCSWCYQAHERLEIIDTASSNRPLTNRSEDIVIAAKDEIVYNNKQLKKTMEPRQHNAQSDYDVFAHLDEDVDEEVVGMQLAGSEMKLALKPHNCERFEEGFAEIPTHLGSQSHRLRARIMKSSSAVSMPFDPMNWPKSLQAYRSIRRVRNHGVTNRVALQSSSRGG